MLFPQPARCFLIFLAYQKVLPYALATKTGLFFFTANFLNFVYCFLMTSLNNWEHSFAMLLRKRDFLRNLDNSSMSDFGTCLDCL